MAMFLIQINKFYLSFSCQKNHINKKDYSSLQFLYNFLPSVAKITLCAEIKRGAKKVPKII